MPESQLRQRIRQALRLTFPGALVIGWPANMWTGGGWPDLLFLEWPLLVGLEVKQGRRSKPTALQLSRHEQLRRRHIPVYVVHTPDEAVGLITTLKEKLPMAFDPNLLAELEAALGAAPPTIQEQADADQNAFDLTNGTATLEELPSFDDAPATPGIEELTALLEANEEVALAETEAVLDAASAQLDGVRLLIVAIDALVVAIGDLRRDLTGDNPPDAQVPQTAEAPAPRRRSRRS